MTETPQTTLEQAAEAIQAIGLPEGVSIEVDREVGGIFVAKGGYGFFVSPKSIEDGYYLTAYETAVQKLVEFHREPSLGETAEHG